MRHRAIIGICFLAGLGIAAQTTREASFTVTIRDADTKQTTPVRVRLTDADGEPPRTRGASTEVDSKFQPPLQAIVVMWGQSDRAQGYALQPDGSFYVDGFFEMRLRAGSYRLDLSKGYEYTPQSHEIEVKAGRRNRITADMERWIDMPSRGWYSSDDHIHVRRSPGENRSILRWIAAEDIHVGNILQMGDFWHYVYAQYGWGATGRYQEGRTILSPGQEEPRTPEFGHTISLGADDFVRFRDDYYSYGRLFDRVHDLGGISGFAHQGHSFHGYRGMTVTVLSGKIDFLELAQFCVSEGPIYTEHYYRFLDLGFRITALAGSDFPWCGRREMGSRRRLSQIGNARFYTYVGEDLTFERWLAAVKAGHTFATTGPILDLKVNGQLPGSLVEVSRGDSVRIEATAYGDGSRIALEELEIVGHGKTLKRVTGKKAMKLSAALEMPLDHGIWIAVRASAGDGFEAHSTPVYVSVDGGGFHNPETLERNLQRCEQDLADLERELDEPGRRLDSQAWRHAASLNAQIEETRSALRDLGDRLGRK